MTDERRDALQPTDAEAVRLARTLVRSARYGALATLDPSTGAPIATRVAVATDLDGAPLVLTSKLAAHTGAMEADPRCSLLVGEPGKGDPLAHARITISCLAKRLERDSEAHAQARRRYLNRLPKASLYVDFPDFAFFRLEPVSASLNGGFARAYRLDAADLLTAAPDELVHGEQRALDHMNADHADAIAIYARAFAAKSDGNWRLTGIDSEGLDLVMAEDAARIHFPTPVSGTVEMRNALVDLAKEGRRKLAEG